MSSFNAILRMALLGVILAPPVTVRPGVCCCRTSCVDSVNEADGLQPVETPGASPMHVCCSTKQSDVALKPCRSAPDHTIITQVVSPVSAKTKLGGHCNCCAETARTSGVIVVHKINLSRPFEQALPTFAAVASDVIVASPLASVRSLALRSKPTGLTLLALQCAWRK